MPQPGPVECVSLASKCCVSKGTTPDSMCLWKFGSYGELGEYRRDSRHWLDKNSVSSTVRRQKIRMTSRPQSPSALPYQNHKPEVHDVLLTVAITINTYLAPVTVVSKDLRAF